jgi:hypothetical protein
MDIKDHIRNELFKNLENFTNEIDLLFDYVPKEVVQKISVYIKSIKGSDAQLNNFLDVTYDFLKEYEVDMSFVLFSKQKVKTQRLNFMNNMKLYPLDNSEFLLNLDLFNLENKNTKKSLLKYIYNIYMTCSFLRKEGSDNTSNSLNEFVSTIQKEAQKEAQEARVQEEARAQEEFEAHVEEQETSQFNLQSLLASTGGASGLPGGMDKMMSSLFNNSEIMGIATDIAEQMKTQQINPMSVLTDMMTGNINNLSENSQFGKLVGNIQQKVESKFNSGEIDKAHFEQEAKNILENVNKENLSNSMPGLSDIMANMMKTMNQK